MSTWNYQFVPWLASGADIGRAILADIEAMPRWVICVLLAVALIAWAHASIRARRALTLRDKASHEASEWQARCEREKLWRAAASTWADDNGIARIEGVAISPKI